MKPGNNNNRGGGRNNFSRTDRLNSLLLKELSLLLQRKVKDPRCHSVILGDVEITKDLSHANIFYQLMGLTDFDPEVQQGLDKAAPFLRGHIKKALRIHTIPNLHFIYDNSFQRGTNVLNILNKLSRKKESDSTESAPETPEQPPQDEN